MTKPVLFSSFRPLERAENINAIYNAYSGNKHHIHTYDANYKQEVQSGKYDILITDDFPTVSPGKCILLWHGIHGGKTIALDQPNHPYFSKKNAELITYIISAGTGMVNAWHICTGIPKERILPLGMPRTDDYINHKHTSNNIKTYLFVPTFRDQHEPPFPSIDWQYLDNNLHDDELLIIKAHPWQFFQSKNDQITNNVNINTLTHIKVAGADEPSAPYLYNADVIITDYSTIMFDAYLLNKPVVLFEKTKGYIGSRGMCFGYPHQYCSFYTRNEQSLLDCIRYRYKHPYLTQTEQNCINIVADKCDGYSCERISAFIDSMKG